MKYLYSIICFALAVIFLFDILEVQNHNALYGVVFLMLTKLFINSDFNKE
jgi:hypothetical protein